MSQVQSLFCCGLWLVTTAAFCAPVDEARELLNTGQSAEAAALLADAAAKDDAVAQVRHVYGLALLAQIDDGDISVFERMELGERGKTELEAAVAAAPDNLAYRETLMEYYLQAPRMAGGDPEKAQAQAAEMLARDHISGTLAHARIATYQLDYPLAVGLVEGALADAPANYELNITRVLALAEAGDHDTARAAIDDWRAAAPDEIRVDYQLGRLAAVSGKFLGDGRAALTRYLAADNRPAGAPEIYWARLRLAMVLRQSGDIATAKAQLTRAEQAAPASDAFFAEVAAELHEALSQPS